jgi:CDP-diglyceride synthetase
MDVIHEETIMFVALVGLFCWILFLLFRRHQLATQAKFQRIEAYNKLLEKFSTAKEFTDFLESEQGKNMLEDPFTDRTNPKKTALRFVQAGGILAALGFGLFTYLSQIETIIHSQANPDINWINKELDYTYWTWTTLALSAGCFVVALLTYTLAKKWNLFPNDTSKR